MFIDVLEKENKDLLEYSKYLWKQGRIEPDTYVIDVDRVLANAQLILNQAKALGIKLYAMTKQIGRNPYLAKAIVELGYEGIVAVDYREALLLGQEGIKVSHIGHLVQVPEGLIEKVLKLEPEVITIYTLDKARSIDNIAKRIGKKQKLLIKVIDDNSLLYDSQEAGFHIDSLDEVIEELKSLKNIEIEGITTFPCILYKDNVAEETVNLGTLIKAKEKLQAIGIGINQINSPSATSVESLEILARRGCTHGEPGHALTGTMPNTNLETRDEKIGILYVTEVSHTFGNKSYCYGGGYYRRGRLKEALIYDSGNWRRVDAQGPLDESIDYHICLKDKVEVGSMVVMAFRTQIFVTRSKVCLVEGLMDGEVRVVGTYDSLGKKLGE